MLYISVRTAETHRAHIMQKLRLGDPRRARALRDRPGAARRDLGLRPVPVLALPVQLGEHRDDARNALDELGYELGLRLRLDLAGELHLARVDDSTSIMSGSIHSERLITSSRISCSIAESERTNARTRSARVTIPTRFPASSTTGRRLTPSSSIMLAAFVSGRAGPIVSAGAVIASPTVAAASFASRSGGGSDEQAVDERPLGRPAGLLEQDVALGDDADDLAAEIDDRQARDPVLGHQRGRLLQRRVRPHGENGLRHHVFDLHRQPPWSE